MSFEPISLPSSHAYFNKLIIDYLNHNPSLKNLYSFSPDKTGLLNAITQIQSVEYKRDSLVDALLRQSQKVNNTSDQTIANINSLKHKNTFAITTGHQLCLFTGPLFFIYKIASIIQLSEQLSQLFPEYHFVPIFWMATEDHDADEINHFYFKDKKFQWNTSSNLSPTGIMDTKDISAVWSEMQATQLFSEEDLNLFSMAYLKHPNISDATRFIVNYLFGDKGIVVIDPMEKTFKQQFIDIFYQDIFENSIYRSIQNTSKYLLNNDYPVQAHPGVINTFFIYNNKRYLLQQENTQFKLKNTTLYFSQQEIKNFLIQHPEYFSPNVLLRPLYQQKILPNIAYIGGTAEISYWLLLRSSFETHSVFYPIVFQRPIIFISPRNIEQKISKLNISHQDIFELNIHQLTYKALEKQHLSIHLQSQKEQIKDIFTQLLQQTERIDTTLLPFVNAELKKTLTAVDTLEHKLNKAIKQKNELITRQIQDIYTTFFPQNTMQDRIWNITYATKILKLNSLKKFVDILSPFCSIQLENYKPLIVLKQNEL